MVNKIMAEKIDDKSKSSKLNFMLETLLLTVPGEEPGKAEKVTKETTKKIPEIAEGHIPSEKEILSNIVIIKGSQSKGTGFVTLFAGTPVVVSNAHVFIGNEKTHRTP